MRPGAELDEFRNASMVEEMPLRLRMRSTVAGRVVVVTVRQLQKRMQPSDLSNSPMSSATRVLPLVWSRERDGTEVQGRRWCRLTRETSDASSVNVHFAATLVNDMDRPSRHARRPA